MSKVLIIGASGGIGAALIKAHRARNDDVVTLSRSTDQFNITDESSIDKHLSAVGVFDRVIVATGILAADGRAPEKTIRAIEAAHMAHVMAVNAIGPALILRHAAQLLDRRAPGLVAVLSARVGSIEDNRLGGWISYRASKAAVNQVVHTAAIELARSHKQSICVALHPGTVRTEFTANYQATHDTVSPSNAAQNLINVMDNLTPAQTGLFFDWKGTRVPW